MNCILIITEIKPKFSKDPVIHEQFELEGYEHLTNIDTSARGVALYIANYQVWAPSL